ncbi:hypothetical protein, partial [Amycolatopsis sp.]|uniref:hypothetical protein n=1 Tax=Amycolatopsis sp. TaxID=37632 RepID=UPI0039C87494
MGLDRPTSGTVTVQRQAPRAARSRCARSAPCSTPSRAPAAAPARWPPPNNIKTSRVPRRGRDQARRRVLLRHEPTPGHRRRTPGRPRTPTMVCKQSRPRTRQRPLL